MVKDPVCGMQLDEKSAAGKVEHEGQTYYFCSSHCLRMFNLEPKKYVAKQEAHSEHHAHH